MPLFRKKPQPVEAWQYMGPDQLSADCALPTAPRGVHFSVIDRAGTRHAFVTTINGDQVRVRHRDWVITEPDGEHHYPCTDKVFRKTYDPA